MVKILCFADLNLFQPGLDADGPKSGAAEAHRHGERSENRPARSRPFKPPPFTSSDTSELREGSHVPNHVPPWTGEATWA